MAKRPVTLRRVVRMLQVYYGTPMPLPTENPFELILWENVVYLASPERRREAFEQLKRTIGTDPAKILAAEPEELESIASRGIRKGAVAAKLGECASIALNRFGGDLAAVIRQPVDAAKRALR